MEEKSLFADVEFAGGRSLVEKMPRDHLSLHNFTPNGRHYEQTNLKKNFCNSSDFYYDTGGIRGKNRCGDGFRLGMEETT